MKKIFGTRAGSLAVIVSATLALGATPVLAIHPEHATMPVTAARSDCSSCHNNLRKTPHFGSAGWDALAHQGIHHR